MGKWLVPETVYGRWNSQYVVILVGFGSGDDCFLLAGSFKICAGIIKDVTITELSLNYLFYIDAETDFPVLLRSGKRKLNQKKGERA